MLVLDICVNNIKYRLTIVFSPNLVSERRIVLPELISFVSVNHTVVLGGYFDFVVDIELGEVGSICWTKVRVMCYKPSVIMPLIVNGSLVVESGDVVK